MVTTIEIPDALFNQAQKFSSDKGQPLQSFIAEAIQSKLGTSETGESKLWMKHFGSLSHLHQETLNINRVVEEEFEVVDLPRVEMILDTNALSAWLDGDKQLVDSLSQAASLELSSISLGEYRFGVLNSVHRSEYETRLTLIEKEFVVLAVTGMTARHYAEIRATLKRLGRPIPFHDIWIAAQAREHNQSIISRDAHFDEVEGVVRISW